MTKTTLTRASLALAAIVLFLLLITPAFIGGRIETATVDALLDMVPPDAARVLEIRQTAFERGWFSSDALIEVRMEELDQLLGEPVTLNLAMNISHGPLLFTPRGLRPGLAYSTIDPELSGIDLEELLGAASLEESPAGSTGTAGSNPEAINLDYTEPLLYLFAGFDSTIELGLEQERLSLESSDSRLNLEQLQGLALVNQDLSAVSSLDLELLQVSTTGQELDLSIQNMSLRGVQSNATDALAPGLSEFTIGELRSDAPLPLAARLVSARFQLAEDPLVDSQLSFSQDFRIAEIDSDLPVASVALSSELNGLDRELLENYAVLIDQYQQASTNMTGQDDTQLTELTQGFLLGLARKPFEFNARLDANAFDGDHNAALAVDWEGLPALRSIDDFSMREAVAGVAIVLSVDADQQALMNSPLGQAVAGYAQQGLLSVANGRVAVDARLVDGILSIGEETLPLDQLINLQ